jgi:hypothetical protein
MDLHLLGTVAEELIPILMILKEPVGPVRKELRIPINSIFVLLEIIV